MKKLIAMTLTFFSLFGCCSGTKHKDLVSVEYFRMGKGFADRIRITITKTPDGYIGKFEEKDLQSKSFAVTKADFDSLANIVLVMKKPGRERSDFIRDLSECLTLTFKTIEEEDDPIEYEYSINHRLSRKTIEQKQQAITLMKRIVDDSFKKNQLNH